MKTPEKIKKGIECCQTMVRCSMCTYNDIGCNAVECQKELFGDSLVLINKLESREKKLKSKIAKLEQRLEQAERERDAAVRDIGEASYFQCSVCKHGDWPNCKKGLNNVVEDEVCKCELFEWRGVCPENSSHDEHEQA